MLYKKTGKPEEGSLVMCTVTNLQYNSVFAKLDEYGITGMIHISEVSPGRIRNIRDYVKEGKVIVCKILKIHERSGHVDLSLRRVSESMRRLKVDELKQEQKSEKIVEFLAKQMKIDVKVLYSTLTRLIFQKYEFLHTCFQEVSIDEVNLEKLGLEKKIAKPLTELIKQRIKPPVVSIRGTLFLTSYDPKGIEKIKEAIGKIKNKDILVRYTKAGQYRIEIRAGDFKEAEEILKENMTPVIDFMEKSGNEASFVKEESRKEKA